MAKPPPREALLQIERAVAVQGAAGASLNEIAEQLPKAVPRRTLQDRVRSLANEGRLVRSGSGRWTRYHAPSSVVSVLQKVGETLSLLAGPIPQSPEGARIQATLMAPLEKRRPVAYNRQFLETYVPNKSFYLSAAQRKALRDIGQTDLPNEPAGTYAKQILQRLLIDLSFNSSRLEGNTYSLIDTRRLLSLGEAAEGKANKETQMILNHKEAIDFLVSDAEEIGFNRHTILNLHGLLSNNLLDDPSAVGRLRWIGVAIAGSVYNPPEIPQIIDELFNQILHTATVISDPFEQAFFALVHLTYLQPFEDVNKRVSRLAANIPLIKQNLRPLSFVDVPKDIYTTATLGVYELNQIELLRDVFIWAYERSAQQYAAVRNTLGEPDAFKLRYREPMRTLINEIIKSALAKQSAVKRISDWTNKNVPDGDREQFKQAVETELASLHEGNFVRFRVRPSEFAEWRRAWDG